MSFGNLVIPWAQHARNGRDLILRAFDVANRMGDLTFAAYCCDSLNSNSLTVGEPLSDLQSQAENGLAFARRARFGFVIDLIGPQVALVRNLRGLTSRFGSFNDDEFDETQFEAHLTANPVLALPECWYFARKAQALFLAGDYISALEASLRALRLGWTSPSQFERVETHFYGALAHAACWDSASDDQRQDHRHALRSHYENFRVWAENCPENFENRAALVGAEIARIEGRTLDAESLYEKAIHSAHANEFLHNEAIAYEVAARFYSARGLDKIANAYLREARYCYLRWGADGKVRQLDQLYPQLGSEEVTRGTTSTIMAPAELLDLATVIEVLQAVSAEMDLDKLIDTIMNAAIEHAGAARGLFIVSGTDGRRIEAEAKIIVDKVQVRRKEAAVDSMPQSIVNYVTRTHESVILDDACSQNQFSADTYISQHHPRSVLCLPMITRGKLVGVLYLENNLAPHVFTSKRATVLKLLASQAAISLENTQLYAELRQREAKIRRLVEANIMAVMIWKVDGSIVESNEAFLRLVQYNLEDVASGRVRWTDLTPPEWQEHDERALAQIQATGTVQPYEKEFLRKDGSRVPVLVAGALFEEGGNEGVAFALDLSEQKQQDADRERLRQQLDHIAHRNRASTIGELTASLAHEINQPIGAASMNAAACLRFLDRDQPNLGEAREAASEMVRDIGRVADIVQRVRSLYRKGSVRLEIVDINEVILEMIVMLGDEAKRHSVTMRTDLAKGPPKVTADRVQLQQVLMNLTLNGIEAMWHAAGELTIKSDIAESGQLLVSVRDTGEGLPVGMVDQIFDAFFTTKHQGTGLGLAITRSIVESHGGRVWATSNSGPGTTFWFTLPQHGTTQS
jgi:PAS domain S-box-containing protein